MGGRFLLIGFGLGRQRRQHHKTYRIGRSIGCSRLHTQAVRVSDVHSAVKVAKSGQTKIGRVRRHRLKKLGQPTRVYYFRSHTHKRSFLWSLFPQERKWPDM